MAENNSRTAHRRGDYAMARALFEESLSLHHDLGYKWGMAISLTNVGNAACVQKEYVTARALYEGSLALRREMDEKHTMAYVLLGLGLVNLAVNKPEVREHILCSLRLHRERSEQLYQTFSLGCMEFGAGCEKGIR